MTKFLLTGIVFLCANVGSRAQLNGSDLVRKFDAYQLIWPKTHIHLTLNQDKFAAGDTVWFKAWFLMEDLKGVPGKQLIALNLSDSQGDSRIHFLFKVYDGVGHNQFAIPETLPAGRYLVTASSNWMKNFQPFPIFKKEITVVRKNTVVPEESPFIRAFPEGGHLVMNIPNKVWLRTNRPNSWVQIVDSASQRIEGTTRTDVNGGASIIFSPMRNARYVARLSGQSELWALPRTEDDGCSLILTSSEAKMTPAKVVVTAPPGSALRQQELTVVVSGRRRIYHTLKFRLGKTELVELSIPETDLPGGVANLSLLDHAGNLAASRDFYTPEREPVYPHIQTPKTSFATREPVTVEVTLTDRRGQPVQGEFSLVARLLDVLEEETPSSGESGIPADEDVDFVVNGTDTSRFADIDSYLISRTEDLPWKEILSAKPRQPLFNFASAIEKKGIAYFGESLVPAPDFTQILFYLQKDKMHYQTFSLGNGHVRLTIPDVYGKDEFFYVAETKRKKEIPDLKIIWEEESIPLPAARRSRESNRPDPYGIYAEKIRLISRSYRFYDSLESTGSPGKQLPDPETFEYEIGGVDVNVDVQKYEVFQTMQELVKEVIPSLYHRKVGGKDIVRVNLPESMHFPTGDPVYIIDGIATRNTTFFLSLKPSDVRAVKIVNDPQKLIPFKLMGKNGIVIVQTTLGNVREPVSDPARVLEGLNEPLNSRIALVATDENKHLPDFRSTIYWNPSIKTDSNGRAVVKFSCSDDVGKIRIVIEGLAKEGKPFSASYQIEVGERSR